MSERTFEITITSMRQISPGRHDIEVHRRTIGYAEYCDAVAAYRRAGRDLPRTYSVESHGTEINVMNVRDREFIYIRETTLD